MYDIEELIDYLTEPHFIEDEADVDRLRSYYRGIVRELGRMGETAEKAAPILTEMYMNNLYSKSSYATPLREEIVSAISNIKKTEAKFFLFKALEDPHPIVVDAAIEAMARVLDEDGIDRLLSILLNHERASVREAAAEAIGYIEEQGFGLYDETILIDALEKVLGSENESLRLTAIESLSKFYEPKALLIMLQIVLEENDPHIWQQITNGFYKLEGFAFTTTEYLIDNINQLLEFIASNDQHQSVYIADVGYLFDIMIIMSKHQEILRYRLEGINLGLPEKKSELVQAAEAAIKALRNMGTPQSDNIIKKGELLMHS